MSTTESDVFRGFSGMPRKSLAQSSANEPQSSEFQIDLQGLIKLLAKNLYAEADVFVREMLQNAHDSVKRRLSYFNDRSPPLPVSPNNWGWLIIYCCDFEMNQGFLQYTGLNTQPDLITIVLCISYNYSPNR